jgi:hypothetical protein
MTAGPFAILLGSIRQCRELMPAPPARPVFRSIAAFRRLITLTRRPSACPFYHSRAAGVSQKAPPMEDSMFQKPITINESLAIGFQMATV